MPLMILWEVTSLIWNHKKWYPYRFYVPFGMDSDERNYVQDWYGGIWLGESNQDTCMVGPAIFYESHVKNWLQKPSRNYAYIPANPKDIFGIEGLYYRTRAMTLKEINLVSKLGNIGFMWHKREMDCAREEKRWRKLLYSS